MSLWTSVMDIVHYLTIQYVSKYLHHYNIYCNISQSLIFTLQTIQKQFNTCLKKLLSQTNPSYLFIGLNSHIPLHYYNTYYCTINECINSQHCILKHITNIIFEFNMIYTSKHVLRTWFTQIGHSWIILNGPGTTFLSVNQILGLSLGLTKCTLHIHCVTCHLTSS